MAGDVALNEALLPISGPGGFAAAAGPILHEYGSSLKIGIGSGRRRAAAVNEETLTEAEKSGLEAFRLRLSEQYVSRKASRPYADMPWGSSTAVPELHRDRQVIIRGAPVAQDPNAPAGAPEAKRLAGRVAVGLIIVSGPGQLAMTDKQSRNIVAEVQNGLSYLGGKPRPGT